MESKHHNKIKWGKKGVVVSLVFIFMILTPFFSHVAFANAVDDIKPLIQAADIAIEIYEGVQKLKPSVPTTGGKESAKAAFIEKWALKVSQYLINQMVGSTIEWANRGFDGGPAYAVDPKGFFVGVADGITSDAITNIHDGKLGFVCAPFQRSLVISLARQYYPENADKPLQCTISGIKGNVDEFFGNFKNGGWEAWYSITQTPANNPYGAFLTAKAQIDSQVAQAIGVQEMELNWGGGFLSVKPCLRRVEGSEECAEWGSTRTPGGLVQSGIAKHIDAEFAQLLDVERFDQLLGALMGGLLDKYVFAKINNNGSVTGGLIRDNFKLDTPTFNVPDPEIPTDDESSGGGVLSCSADRNFGPLNTPIIWNIASSLPDIPLSFVWDLSGDPAITGSTNTSITVTYGSEGVKTGSVQAIILATGEPIAGATCSNSVFISNEE